MNTGMKFDERQLWIRGEIFKHGLLVKVFARTMYVLGLFSLVMVGFTIYDLVIGNSSLFSQGHLAQGGALMLMGIFYLIIFGAFVWKKISDNRSSARED